MIYVMTSQLELYMYTRMGAWEQGSVEYAHGEAVVPAK